MKQQSYAHALLEHWGIKVDPLPTGAKKQADFMATFGQSRVLIEEKTKLDDEDYLAQRDSELEAGKIHAATLPIRRNETLAGIVSKASKQLRSSADTQDHDFRLIWFTATDANAQGTYEQFMATLYGYTNVIEKDVTYLRRCFYFLNSDFYRRAAVLDGAVVAYLHGTKISARLCLNSLSPRYEILKNSQVMLPFGTAVEDPLLSESKGNFILDAPIDRRDGGAILEYLRTKYKTGPLMRFDMGYTSATVLVPPEDYGKD